MSCEQCLRPRTLACLGVVGIHRCRCEDIPAWVEFFAWEPEPSVTQQRRWSQRSVARMIVLASAYFETGRLLR
jgi:hypothetical protein